MMGQHKSDPQLFNYAVNLEKRVRAAHPLRRVKATIDFGFVREEVAHCYGKNGNESVAPEVILKMMFLLFFDDIKSERELMEVIGERLDYLWFLDYGLDQKIPDHSVLSKARARWGKEVFESLFVRTVAQCVEAGLVDGSKLHVDASLVDAGAANNHHFKRARWRRLWRQQIQDYLIAAIQNVRILLAHQYPKPGAAVALPASITRLQPGFAY